MSVKQKAFSVLTAPIRKIFSRSNMINTTLHQNFSMKRRVRQGATDLLFYCPNRMTLMRAETFFTKEPDTIEWLDSFKPGEVLFDVGSNVGLYTLYAAQKGVRVVAFEPESQNYALLNHNIYLNSLSDRVCALNLALNSENKLDYLYLNQFMPGGALNNFGEEVDYEKKSFHSAFKQGACAFALDSFIDLFQYEVPDHLKIDVDGLEAAVIDGARVTLKNKKLKSILIELNTKLPEDLKILETLKSAGFKVKRQCHCPLVNKQFDGIDNFTLVRDQ